ncbi:hypothetical protein [Rhodococcus sp. NPDC060176]|uniref:hypothetical protein n=1 Tax=Rhodococcus sp. NPDC060176 TaxID=3347062 RepID=UPI00365EC9C1
MNPPEMHPLVIWAGVVAAVFATVAVIMARFKEIAAPIAVWLSSMEERRIERQARIEAAARILNDARVDTLSVQVRGLAGQLDEALREIVSLRAELHAERSARERLAELEAENAVLRTRVNGLGGV